MVFNFLLTAKNRGYIVCLLVLKTNKYYQPINGEIDIMPEVGAGSKLAARVFRAIWQHPHISRVEISKSLGIEKSTVTNEVGKLMDAGIVEETKEGDASSRGGRRPISLAVSRSAGHLIGIDLGRDSYTAVAVDLLGTVIDEMRGSIDIRGDNFTKSVLQVIKECTKKLKGDTRLLGTGIGISGLVSSKESTIRHSRTLGIHEKFDFAQEVASKLQFPCFIENDADCCACGELAFNRGEDMQSFLFTLVEQNDSIDTKVRHDAIKVGFGLVLYGKVYAGSHGCTGEFRSVLCDSAGNNQFSISEKEMSRFRTDRAVQEKVADELARNIAFIVNIVDFDRVLIGGVIQSYGIDLPSKVQQRLKDNWGYLDVPKEINVKYSKLGDQAVAYGAAGMTLERLVTDLIFPGSAKASSQSSNKPMRV
jgi:predicted NBD/HSP70 family sugar kinase